MKPVPAFPDPVAQSLEGPGCALPLSGGPDHPACAVTAGSITVFDISVNSRLAACGGHGLLAMAHARDQARLRPVCGVL
jgi:hypothetical protein